MTKIDQLWDLIETSSFLEDIKENVDDYNNKEDNNKNDTYNKDNKVDCPVNSQTQTQSNKKMSGLYNHLRIDLDIYKFIVILGEGAKNNPRGGRHFLYTTTGYICNSVIRSVGPSVQNLENKIKFKFSALVLDRDLGVSRGHQSDDKDKDEEDEEEVKEVNDDKDDNEEAKEDDEEEENNNYQTIKCLTFSESQAQAQLNDDDDKDEEVEEDKDDNKEDNEVEDNDINSIKPKKPIYPKNPF